MRTCEVLNCGKVVWGTDKLTRTGYCKFHQHLRTDISKESIIQKAIAKQRKNAIPKIQSKLRSLSHVSPDIREGEDYGSLRQWFLDRRKEMQNVCIECGKGTNRDSDKYFKWSICHIAPKALIKSVATNENNWVELCWLHHQEFDSTFDKAAAMQCFGEIKQKFQLFKHLIPPQEMRKINPYLLT